METEISIVDLEKRVAALEQITVSTTAPTPHPIVQGLINVNNKMKTAVDGRPGLASLMKKTPQINTVLDAKIESEISLPIQSKAEIVLASETTIAKTATLLQELDELKDFVNTPTFENTLVLINKQAPEVEVKHSNNAAVAKQIESHFLEMLSKYNQLVETLSTQFVEWDRILTVAEATVSELQKKPK